MTTPDRDSGQASDGLYEQTREIVAEMKGIEQIRQENEQAAKLRAKEREVKTLADVKKAFEDGYFSAEKGNGLGIDNDCVVIWAPDPDGEEGDCIDIGHLAAPEDLLIEALGMLGIPAEGV